MDNNNNLENNVPSSVPNNINNEQNIVSNNNDKKRNNNLKKIAFFLLVVSIVLISLGFVFSFGVDAIKNNKDDKNKELARTIFEETGMDEYLKEVFIPGVQLNTNLLDSTNSYKSVSNYHIEAYQSGELKVYGDSADYSKATETYKYAANPEKFEATIELVQVSASNTLTDAMRKEAVVALLEKYGLEINEQIVHDYIKSQYPDYFDEEDK